MPVGVILLIMIAFLIYFGLMHRVLDRMKLDDSTALAFIGAMIVGTFMPNIPLGPRFYINIGGGVVPIAIVVYILFTAKKEEKTRGLSSALITGIAVFIAGRSLPAEPDTMVIEPLIVYSILAGIISYIFGRSRRGAFISGILGITISDLIYAFYTTPRPATTVIGGAGVFDAQILSAIIAVGLCEIVGEAREKLSGGSYAKKKHEKAEKLTSMLVDDSEKSSKAGENDGKENE